jgi:hypothetical protein|tara:strand:- start:3640 stop:3795 length:156 start_codon:yes stop_codon:yes gene_type:complete
MSNFHFSEIVSENHVSEKHVYSIMLRFGFFGKIFDCIKFFNILSKNSLGDF